MITHQFAHNHVLPYDIIVQKCKIIEALFKRNGNTEPSVFTEPEPELIAICKFAVMEDSIFDFFFNLRAPGHD